MIEPLPAELPGALMKAGAYPDDDDARVGIDHIQTHISHVFLTKTRVYKIRKAVDLGFLSFAARSERNADCLNELRLNRRLAPDVYLGIAPLAGNDEAGWQVGPVEEDPARLAEDREHCVVMRRLPTGRDALSLLEAGQLTAAQLDRVASCLARFHRENGLGAPAPFETEQWRARIAGPVEANYEAIDGAGDAVVAPSQLDALRRASNAAMDRLSERFEQRRVEGRAVDAHGDLHLQHIWLSEDDADPLIIDCLEFSEELRRIDSASELAFLAMDLGYRGAGALGERLLRQYAAQSDDFDLYTVVDFFVSYRAAVRAKVAAIAATDDAIEPRQRKQAARSAVRHVDYALRALQPAPPGSVVLVGGPVGVGKSSVARALADEIAGVVISSDRVRKAMAGLDPTDRMTNAPGQGMYSDAERARVYTALLERAAPVVDSGRTAILDATYSTSAQRKEALRWANARGAACCFVEVGCDVAVTRRRLEERSARNDDPSDAGPDLVDASAQSFEALAEWPPERRIAVRSDEPDWQTKLSAALHALALAPSAGLPSAAPAEPGPGAGRDRDTEP